MTEIVELLCNQGHKIRLHKGEVIMGKEEKECESISASYKRFHCL